ncbi:MAG: hypothetical protein M3011_13390, partial [Actinomycetota bacterium]|nr:hypothetical protein [Actinomycetota bacterium]
MPVNGGGDLPHAFNDSPSDVNDRSDVPVLADYAGASLIGVVPGLLEAPGQRPAWFPPPAGDAAQVVLLVVDGLGWRQLAARRH